MSKCCSADLRDANRIPEAPEGIYRRKCEGRANKEPGYADHSVSQYGVLGMWPLEQAGAKIPPEFWQISEDVWKRDHGADGSWLYEIAKPAPNKGGSFTMTAAGVATLFITQDYLHSNEGLTPKGNITNPAIEKGLAWISKNINAVSGGNTYALYGVERIGVASGLKYFGDVDWFAMGARTLVLG